MLTQNTVFILGAGANVPYGFSTGGGLIDKLRGVDPQARMGNAGQQITRQESEAFRVACWTISYLRLTQCSNIGLIS